jgi:hypothetical protein
MEINHTRNEEKKTTDYIVTVTDSELEEFKEKMVGSRFTFYIRDVDRYRE